MDQSALSGLGPGDALAAADAFDQGVVNGKLFGGQVCSDERHGLLEEFETFIEHLLLALTYLLGPALEDFADLLLLIRCQFETNLHLRENRLISSRHDRRGVVAGTRRIRGSGNWFRAAVQMKSREHAGREDERQHQSDL